MAQKAPKADPLEGVEIQVDESGTCSAQVHLRVPAEQLKGARVQIAGNLRKRFRVKGFRPGKAPLPMVEKHFGGEIDQEVLRFYLERGVQKAVADHELHPAAQPRIDLQDYPEAGKDLEIDFEIPLRPSIELGELEGLRVDGQEITVADAELDDAIRDLKRQQSRVEPAQDAGLEEEGMMLCKIAYTVDGEDEPALEREGIRLTTKTTPWGVEAEDFEKGVLGAKVGDERSFSVELPDEFPIEEARGKKASLAVRFDEVYKVTPPSDEELFASMDVTTEAGLKESVRARIHDYKQGAENHRVENALIEKILQDHPFEVPELLVRDQVEGRLGELRESLAGEGLDEATIDERVHAEREGAENASRQGLKAIYLFEEIAKAKDLLLKAEDFEAEFQSIALRNNTSAEDVRKYYSEQSELVNRLGLELLERKVRSFLRESADIQLTAAD